MLDCFFRDGDHPATREVILNPKPTFDAVMAAE
jgi:hypothetical protein